ncbi:MAG: hypothetical protein ACI8SE_001156, partial [Bacteroidia bacterium]
LLGVNTFTIQINIGINYNFETAIIFYNWVFLVNEFPQLK